MCGSSGLFGAILPVAGGAVLVIHSSGAMGLLLILLALGLFAADLHLGLTGILALAGVAALTAGVLVLVSTIGVHIGLPLWLITVIVAFVALLCVAWLRSLWRSHRRAPIVGEQSMVGRKAKALTALDPFGYVQIGGESWRARLTAGHANPGELVTVVEVHGLELEVRRLGKGILGQQSTPFSGHRGRED